MGLGQKSRKPEELAVAVNAVTAIDSQLKKSSSRKMKCKCPLGSPFHWKSNPRPSMFIKDPLFTAGAKQSQSQTMVIERAREKGKDISHFPGISDKSDKKVGRISVREFNVFSRAGQKL